MNTRDGGVSHEVGRSVYLDMEPTAALDQDLSRNALEERVIGDTNVYYDSVEHLFVPANHELSAEEIQREREDPHFTIAYGSDTVTTSFSKDVAFNKDGVQYLLLTFDDVNAEELFEMAEEILEAGR